MLGLSPTSGLEEAVSFAISTGETPVLLRVEGLAQCPLLMNFCFDGVIVDAERLFVDGFRRGKTEFYLKI